VAIAWLLISSAGACAGHAVVAVWLTTLAARRLGEGIRWVGATGFEPVTSSVSDPIAMQCPLRPDHRLNARGWAAEHKGEGLMSRWRPQDRQSAQSMEVDHGLLHPPLALARSAA
jgi:hypothetical protein